MRHLVDTAGAIWLFGYRSLVWRRDFPYQHARRSPPDRCAGLPDNDAY
ncbi:gamma-glutamylcyclotransferase [Methyloceanibacter sp.]